MYAYDQLLKAQLENLSSDPTPSSTARIYWSTTLSRVRIYNGTSWETLPGASDQGFAPQITGTYTAATAIVAATGIVPAYYRQEVQFIAGSGGAVTVTANPQVAYASSNRGDILRLVGTSDTNTVLLSDGTGLLLNGPWLAELGSCLSLMLVTATLWLEIGRNEAI